MNKNELNDKNEINNVAESLINLKKIYKKTTFFTSYGTSIFLFIFITMIFFLFFSYYNVMNNIHKYRIDPSKYRCHPTVMPFAGYIYPHPGMSNTEFNRYNFRYCTREILGDLLGKVLEPFEYIASILQQIQTSNVFSLNYLRQLFSNIRFNVLGPIVALIFSLLTNLFAGLNRTIVYISDAIIKSTQILESGSYMSNIILYCIRVIARTTIWSIAITLTIIGVIMLLVFAYTYITVYVGLSSWLPIGPIIAPFFSYSIGLLVSLVYVVLYIIVCVIYGTVANEIQKGLSITSPLAPQKPRFRIPNIFRRRRRR